MWTSCPGVVIVQPHFPIYFPRVSAIGREGLLPLRGSCGDLIPSESHHDGLVVERLVGKEHAFAVMESPDDRYVDDEALFLAGVPGLAQALGLGDALDSAEIKVSASLVRGDITDPLRIQSRFHVDPTRWFVKRRYESFARRVERSNVERRNPPNSLSELDKDIHATRFSARNRCEGRNVVSRRAPCKAATNVSHFRNPPRDING